MTASPAGNGRYLSVYGRAESRVDSEGRKIITRIHPQFICARDNPPPSVAEDPYMDAIRREEVGEEKT